MPVAARQTCLEPERVGIEKTSFSWIHTVASFVALLCSVAVEYVLDNGVTVTSHGVVTHDYLCQVVEHLKGSSESRRQS